MRKLVVLAGVIAALVASMSLSAPSASADTFCWGSNVNNANKCWGAGRNMYVAYAKGAQTGVCVGADTTQGNCVPTGNWAAVSVPIGLHYPWIIGTASNFTTAFGEVF